MKTIAIALSWVLLTGAALAGDQKIQASGVGKPPKHKSASMAKQLAAHAARNDAKMNLTAKLLKVQPTIIKGKKILDDYGLLKGCTFENQKTNPDATVEVVAVLTMEQLGANARELAIQVVELQKSQAATQSAHQKALADVNTNAAARVKAAQAAAAKAKAEAEAHKKVASDINKKLQKKNIKLTAEATTLRAQIRKLTDQLARARSEAVAAKAEADAAKKRQ